MRKISEKQFHFESSEIHLETVFSSIHRWSVWSMNLQWNSLWIRRKFFWTFVFFSDDYWKESLPLLIQLMNVFSMGSTHSLCFPLNLTMEWHFQWKFSLYSIDDEIYEFFSPSNFLHEQFSSEVPMEMFPLCNDTSIEVKTSFIFINALLIRQFVFLRCWR